MSTSEGSDVECWNCGEENFIVYGGSKGDEIYTCDNCDEVIGLGDMDSLTIPKNQQDALDLADRYALDLADRYSDKQREETDDCNHPPDKVIPLSYSTDYISEGVTVTTSYKEYHEVRKLICLDCGKEIGIADVKDGGLWS